MWMVDRLIVEKRGKEKEKDGVGKGQVVEIIMGEERKGKNKRWEGRRIIP